MKKSIEEYLHKKQKELYAGLMLHLKGTSMKVATIKNFFLNKKDGSKWEISTTIKKLHEQKTPDEPRG